MPLKLVDFVKLISRALVQVMLMRVDVKTPEDHEFLFIQVAIVVDISHVEEGLHALVLLLLGSTNLSLWKSVHL